MSPRRLLVISYHYPPDGAVGGLRWAGLTRGLSELGWSSWVLTAAQGSIEDVPGVVVVRPARRMTLNDRYVAWRRSRSVAQPEPSRSVAQPEPSRPVASASDGANTPRGLSSFREFVSNAGLVLSLPDDGRGWILRATFAARKLIRTIKPSVVITSGPPHSAHIVGRLACWPGGPDRFIDLRDPILSRAYTPLGPVHGPVRRSIERFAIASARGAICVTAESAAELAGRHPALRVEHVPNGVDLTTIPAAADAQTPFPGLSIAHVGTLYASRDPSIALRAMRRFVDRHPDARDALKLRLVGGVERLFAERLAALSRALELNGNIEMVNAMPRVDALQMLRRSRVALIFAQRQVVQVPAKLYEAAAIARDVIVVTEPDSASAQEAARIGASVVAPDDDEALAVRLERVWRGERLNDRSADVVRAIDYRVIARRLADVLDDHSATTPENSVASTEGGSQTAVVRAAPGQGPGAAQLT